MYKKIFKILNKQEKRFFLIIIFLVLVNASLETIGIAAIVPLISLIIQPDFLNDYSYISGFILNISKALQPDSFFEKNNIQSNLIIGGVACFSMVFLFKTIFFIFLNYIHSTFTHNLIHSISAKLYKGYLNLNYIFHSLTNSVSLKQNVLEESPIMAGTMNSFLVIITEIFILLFITIFLLTYNFFASIFLFIFFIVISYLIFKGTKSKLIFWGSERVKQHEKAFKFLQEGLESIKEI